jgi:hypothetical protein
MEVNGKDRNRRSLFVGYTMALERDVWLSAAIGIGPLLESRCRGAILSHLAIPASGIRKKPEKRHEFLLGNLDFILHFQTDRRGIGLVLAMASPLSSFSRR